MTGGTFSTNISPSGKLLICYSSDDTTNYARYCFAICKGPGLKSLCEISRGAVVNDSPVDCQSRGMTAELQATRQFARESSPWGCTKKSKSRDLDFFIHCESNGISSRFSVNIIRLNEHISFRRVYHQPAGLDFLSQWWYTKLRFDDMQFLWNWWYTRLRLDCIVGCHFLQFYLHFIIISHGYRVSDKKQIIIYIISAVSYN